MREQRQSFLVDLIRVTDLVVMCIAFCVAFVVAGQSMGAGNLSEFLAVRVKLLNLVFFVGWLVAWHLILKSFGLFRSGRAGVVASEWWTLTKAVSVGTLVLSFAAIVLNFLAINALFLISFFWLVLLGTIIARVGLRSFFSESRRNGSSLKRLVIVGCGPRGAEFGNRVRKRPDFGYLLLGFVDEMPPPDNPLHGGPEKILGPPDRLREIIETHSVDEVVVTLPIASHYQTISSIIAMCEELAVDVLMPTDFFESRLVNVAVNDSRAWPAMELRDPGPSAGSAIVKRVIDICASVVALIVLSPLMAIIAIAIRLDSPGPVFFWQDRVGLKRKMFKMHKFRTMEIDSEERIDELEAQNEVNGAAFKMSRDPRVTRVGRFLRKLSLDELPQFVDVLQGNMSLVGPRPLPTRDVERFDSFWQKRRFSVKPGLTCLWQINGRHEIDFEHWMELDLQYIDNWSLLLDFEILLKTLPAVLRGSGAS